MRQIRRTRRRPDVIARALGAPVPGRSTADSTLTARAGWAWLALASALLLVAVATVMVTGRERPAPLVIAEPSAAPSAQPSLPPETTRPRSSTATGPSLDPGCFVAPQMTCTASIRDVVDSTLGFTFAGGSEWTNAGGDGTSSRSFGYGSCWDRICTKGYAEVRVGTIEDGLDVGTDTATDLIRGATLGELASAWEAHYGTSSAEPAEIGGVPALAVTSASRLFVFAIHRDRIYGFQSRVPAFTAFVPRPPHPLAEDRTLSAFLAGFAFLDPMPSCRAP